ncbi:RluA family pseudouridine synthase [Patescibacteria group bacterium]|nr:RluA family pseudouridine synthase [Patescibacteria group bacterium]
MKFIADNAGERLDIFLVARLEGLSRSRVQRLIEDKQVAVNGKVLEKPSYRMHAGDEVVISAEDLADGRGSITVEPEADMPLQVVYEDKNILVINKPAGLLVHPTASQHRHTLANALVAQYPEMIGVGEDPLRPGIVHRLDKDTSGLMVVAKNQRAFLFLKDQFLHRTMAKTYLALVEGIPEPRAGEITFAIRPSSVNPLKKIAVRMPDGAEDRSARAAETQYRVKRVFGTEFALVEASPKTGRTHQIRVHLRAIGHAVLGDRVYHSKNPKDYGELQALMKRQMLHAYRLQFTAPGGKRIDVKAPIPKDMAALIAQLRKRFNTK